MIQFEAKLPFRLISLVVSVIVLLTGCLVNFPATTPGALESKTREKIAKINPKSYSLVREIRGPYVDTTAIETTEGKKRTLRRHVNFYVRDIEFSEAIDYLLGQEQIPYVLADDVLPVIKRTVSINYQGELSGVVEQLASLIGGSSRVDDFGVIRIFRTATRDYPIAVPGGDISWTMSAGGTQLGGASGGLGGGSSGGGSGGGGESGGSTVSDSGTISASASLSLWDDISNSLEQFLNERGTFFVSQAAGLITVTAPVSVLDEVDAYVESINHQLTRRVEIQFQLLEVSLSRDTDLGIDWTAIRQEARVELGETNYGVGRSITSGAPGGISESGSGAARSNSFVIQDASTIAGGVDLSRVLVNALRKQGHVTIAHSPTAVTLNNQPVILSDILNQSYAAETTAGLSTSTGVTTGGGVTPGQITSGSQFMVIPKIVGTDIVIYVQAIIANNLGSTRFATGSGSAETVIELPNVASKGFAVRVKMNDGGAALIGGLTREVADISEEEPFFIDILGNTERKSTRVETILMVQAKILEG